MDPTKKPTYNMWQNTAFMLGNAWRSYKSVPLLCVGIAASAAGGTIAQLLLAPAVLEQVETHAPLETLVGVILAFGAVLFALYGLNAYLKENAIYGRIAVRTGLVTRLSDKAGRHLLCQHAGHHLPQADPTVLQHLFQQQRSHRGHLDHLDRPADQPDRLCRLSGAAVRATSAAAGGGAGHHGGGLLFSNRINAWVYRHRDEEEEYWNRFGYLQRTATDRSYAKDIRIFGLKPWLDEVWARVRRLFQDYLKQRQLHYLWIDVADLALTFARDGIAYAYLIWLALTEGLPVSQFLLYFTAVSGFTQWVTGILSKGTELHRQSLEISLLRETLDWPEPFRFEGANRCPAPPICPARSALTM